MGGWMERIWKIYDVSIGNTKPEVVVGHFQAPPSSFQMEMDGSHFMSIWGSRERTGQCARDSCWHVNGL